METLALGKEIWQEKQIARTRPGRHRQKPVTVRSNQNHDNLVKVLALKLLGGFFIFLGYMLLLSMSWNLVDIVTARDPQSAIIYLAIQIVGGPAAIWIGLKLRGWSQRLQTLCYACFGYGILGAVLGYFVITEFEPYSHDYLRSYFYFGISAVMFLVGLYIFITSSMCSECSTLIGKHKTLCDNCSAQKKS